MNHFAPNACMNDLETFTYFNGLLPSGSAKAAKLAD
ncbi:hypothetical protein PF010_g6540 [Phytophthora fragariae]|uniref:Uncharacterized protein n=1 Tax=Phytophthora fragariae TaxID=53985 RepID=A0A6A4EG23_9STRA|nr:hypothetical protein PF009_g7842 [Phytophthora fragariae]KAE9018689.1 hypothetical protein PF011_g6153 [Phytophthora fragariae]KAE9122282.1 hypothetical protein PF007_g7507 [Phytophthora fragariae]KAE9123087.1 hypothetical protein PF010_g6540 [Phytophthora fragariae]KAE9148988.1 hypothetical protein PF006_g6492 [Phytophthora fragariae]